LKALYHRTPQSEVGLIKRTEAARQFVVRPQRLDWRIWLLALGTFVLGTDAFVIAGILPQLAAGLDVGTEAAGQIVSVYSLTYAFGAPLLAAIAAKWGRGHVVVGALAAFAVVNVMSALVPSYSLMLAVRFLAGICAALFAPAAYALATELTPQGRRGSALALVSMGLAVSTVVGVPAGSWVGIHLGWRASFLLIAALSAVGVFGLLTGKISETSSSSGESQTSLKAGLAPVARLPVLLALLPMLLWSTAYFTVYTYAALFLARQLPTTNVAALFLALGLGCLVGNRLGGRLSDRWGPFWPIAGCTGLGALTVAMMGLAPPAWPSITILLFAWGVCSWANFAPQQSLLLTIEPKHAALVLSLNNSMNYLGSALGAALGAIILTFGWVLLLPLAGALLYLLALTAFLLSTSVTNPKERLPKAASLVRPQAL
jgi:MFS transporter, DHA1 family, inner membrane transport protein